MAAIQEELKKQGISSFNDVKAFFEGHNIRVKESKKYPKLYLLMYHFVGADFKHQFVRESRGIVLEKESNRVIGYPFNKFFNYSETYADKVDWNTVSIQEKLDGSLIKVFWYNDEFVVATNGMIDAQEYQREDGTTFYDLFMDAAHVSKLDFTKLLKRHTYMFELIHPKNIIVVQHTEPRLVHIGTRDNQTYQEIHADIGIEKPKTFQFGVLEDILKFVKTMPANQEGFVICDSKFRRNKIKGSAYIELHHIASKCNPFENCLKLYLRGEMEEVLIGLPHYKPYFQKIDTFITKVIGDMNDLYVQIEEFSRKDYAIKVKEKLPQYMAIMMKKFTNRDATFLSLLGEMNIKILLSEAASLGR